MSRAASATSTPIFGFTPSVLDAGEAAQLVLARPAGGGDTARVLVTPNIQHVALMRHDAALAAAVRGAEVRLCDGFPVHLYARSRGHRLADRVTGRDVVARIMADPARLANHRLVALVDGEAVASALEDWAAGRGLAAQVRAVVAPPALLADEAAQHAIVATMRAFAPTIVLLCLGAPTSERLAHRFRTELAPAWLLCVGQSVKIVLGLVPRPPAIVARFNLEWAWRIALEPRRLASRYAASALGFVAAMLGDRRR